MEVGALASLLGLPTISVPVGFNKEGLPMGMKIIAKNMMI
ncbi:amidase family protein [Candidatus Pelagibacter sp.]|nr:amidase family protein [Candidatus Pelagibacter sp.]